MTAPDGTFRVASWNIRGAVGADRRCDPGRILDGIGRIRPAIIALQEIDGRAQFGRMELAFERFAAGLGDHLVEARTVLRARRDYGHLLWSRWPVERQAVRRLPGGRIEPRFAIDVVLTTPMGPLRVLSAHLGLMPNDRRAQAAALRDWVGEAEGLPTLLLGDLNEWRLGGPVDAALSSVLPVRCAPRSWPARRPIARMDRIYASDGVGLVPEEDVPDLRAFSDHRCVCALVRLPAGR